MMINYFSCQRLESMYFPAAARFKNTCFIATDEEKLCFPSAVKKKFPRSKFAIPDHFLLCIVQSCIVNSTEMGLLDYFYML